MELQRETASTGDDDQTGLRLSHTDRTAADYRPSAALVVY